MSFLLTETPGFFPTPVRSCSIEACEGGRTLKLVPSKAVEKRFSTSMQTADGHVTVGRSLGKITAQHKRCQEDTEEYSQINFCIFITRINY